MRTPTPRACTAVVTLAFVAIATTGCADDSGATGVRAPGANAQVVLTITGAAGGRSYREETLVDSTTRRYRYRSCVGGIGEKNCTPASMEREGEVLPTAFGRLFTEANRPAFRALNPRYARRSGVVPPDGSSATLEVTANGWRRTVTWEIGAAIPFVLQDFICLLQSARGDLLLCD